MSWVTSPKRCFKWLYHEFGLDSIYLTGRDAYLIIIARTCRMFAYGTNSLILAIFFSALGFSDHRIGAFMTLTLLGDVLLGTALTLVADRVGRRKVLIGGSLLLVGSGLVFALFENFWILLLAAILGVISITGGDFGPFRSIEESILSHLTNVETRPDVLSWYVTTSTLGSSIGSEVSGRLVSLLEDRPGWTPIDAYHALFWVYTAMGFVNLVLVLAMTEQCELSVSAEFYGQVPQHDSSYGEAEHHSNVHRNHESGSAKLSWPKTWMRTLSNSWLFSQLSQVNASTRSTMFKLWLLLAVDSLADGMVPYSLVNYYLDNKFHPEKSTLGDVLSASYFLGTIGAAFAGLLARKIGLINTMVFTHAPSSAAVLIFPLPPALWAAILLLLVRAGLNNMDQAPRSAFIAAVVKPEERTAVMGITGMVRTLAAMAGPTLTGIFAANENFWVAFVVAGACRLAYDAGLYLLFVNTVLDQHERDSSYMEPNLAHSGRMGERDIELSTTFGANLTVEGERNSMDVQARSSGASMLQALDHSRERSRSRSPSH